MLSLLYYFYVLADVIANYFMLFLADLIAIFLADVYAINMWWMFLPHWSLLNIDSNNICQQFKHTKCGFPSST